MAREAGADPGRIQPLKKLLLQASREVAGEAGLENRAGLLCDSTFGQDVLNAATGAGWWIGRPVELPGSRPLELEHGNIGSQLVDWPLEHVVKCLVFYHPDDEPGLRLQQEAKIREVYEACCKSGHELLLEVILPAGSHKSDEHYIRAVKRFYNLGVKPDWWKLPPLADAGWSAMAALIDERDPHCRGVVLLGLDASQETLAEGFAAAAGHGIVKGFTVGRTLFGRPAKAWLEDEIDDAALVAAVKANYRDLIALWRQRGQEIQPPKQESRKQELAMMA